MGNDTFLPYCLKITPKEVLFQAEGKAMGGAFRPFVAPRGLVVKLAQAVVFRLQVVFLVVRATDAAQQLRTAQHRKNEPKLHV